MEEPSDWLFKLRPITNPNSPDPHPDTATASSNTDELQSLPTIYLFQNQAVTLGRSRLTQIRDLFLSRKQVRILASSSHVEATQLNEEQPSFVNGQQLIFPWSKMLVEGDTVCLKANQYSYVLEKPTGNSLSTPKSVASKKRSAATAFAIETPITPTMVKSSCGKVRTSRSRSAPWTPQDLVNQLNLFGSAGKVSLKGLDDQPLSTSSPKPAEMGKDKKPPV